MGKSARITVTPKRSLGQNFLVDDNIARNIVRDLHLVPDDVVVEIGPGQGALTKHLVPRAQHLVAMEIDQRVIEGLEKQFASPSVSILRQDFLEARLSELSHTYGRKLRVVGNIPYHLTSPILFKVFEERDAVQDITVMMQREVARRIVAKPGTKEYGILSLFARFYGTPRLLFDVSQNCFYPKPNVISTVVQITMRDASPIDIDANLFGIVVRTAFGKRRKTLRNNLKYLPYNDDDVLRQLYLTTTLSLERRAEELTVEEFIILTKELQYLIA
jgi:16S rRNA (adenine1518-N6/adenine1519-N6)-dimethyltransferase